MNAIEVIRRVAEDESRKMHPLELGTVTSVFPHEGENDSDNYECNVKLKNRDLELRRVPISVHHVGFTSAPNVGDLVILGFIQGDINAPVLLGRLYNDENRPPINRVGETVYESPDPEKAGIRRFYIKLPNGIAMNTSDEGVRMEVGKTAVTIKTDGDVIIESNAQIEVKAKGDLTLSGQNITIESQEALDLKAGTTGKLESSLTLDIKGAMVNIN